jgi:6-phosphogluconolactonase
MQEYDLSMGAQVEIFTDPAALAEGAAQLIAEAARDAVAARGRFLIALAGGATPRQTYERLALPPFRDAVPWARTFVFFGDERCVPPDHPESNYRMASQALLSRVGLPPEQVFRMRGEAEDSDAAAAEYARTLTSVFGTRRGEVPRFDLILLGMGLDGHTGSLFPGSPVLKEVFRTVAAVHVTAAAIPHRLTLTFPVLNAAAQVIFLVSGAEKAKTMKSVLADPGALPAGLVVPGEGQLLWMVDRAAASRLE